MPSNGIDRRTGKVLTGLDHVRQSLEIGFSTPLMSRIMRRTFGFAGLPLLGRQNLTPDVLLRFYTAIHIYIALWEPRLASLRAFYPAAQNTPEGWRQGRLGLRLRCQYRPNALQGDLTSDVVEIDL